MKKYIWDLDKRMLSIEGLLTVEEEYFKGGYDSIDMINVPMELLKDIKSWISFYYKIENAGYKLVKK